MTTFYGALVCLMTSQSLGLLALDWGDLLFSILARKSCAFGAQPETCSQESIQ